MFNSIDKKKYYLKWRLDLLNEMKEFLEGFKVLGGKELLDHAKHCGKVSEHLKKQIEKMK